MKKVSFLQTLVATLFFATVGLSTAGIAQQASGPIVRCLDGSYYLMQCNAVQLQVDETVVIKRAGQEVGRGRIVRSEGQFRSLLLERGEAGRMDMVYSTTTNSQQGPAMPVACGKSSTFGSKAAEKPMAKTTGRPKSDDFFSGLQGGRVLDLTGGQVISR